MHVRNLVCTDSSELQHNNVRNFSIFVSVIMIPCVTCVHMRATDKLYEIPKAHVKSYVTKPKRSYLWSGPTDHSCSNLSTLQLGIRAHGTFLIPLPCSPCSDRKMHMSISPLRQCTDTAQHPNYTTYVSGLETIANLTPSWEIVTPGSCILVLSRHRHKLCLQLTKCWRSMSHRFHGHPWGEQRYYTGSQLSTIHAPSV